MQPEWTDLFLITSIVILAKLFDIRHGRAGSRLARHSRTIAKESANEAQTVAKQHEKALHRALKEIR